MENVFGCSGCAQRGEEHLCGAVLVGKGQMWADDLTLEVVDKSVSVTKPDPGETAESDSYAKIPKATNKRPVNMSFEEGRVPLD